LQAAIPNEIGEILHSEVMTYALVTGILGFFVLENFVKIILKHYHTRFKKLFLIKIVEKKILIFKIFLSPKICKNLHNQQNFTVQPCTSHN
jgi:hypothetical protein